jgi:hypothetical protein
MSGLESTSDLLEVVIHIPGLYYDIFEEINQALSGYSKRNSRALSEQM